MYLLATLYSSRQWHTEYDDEFGKELCIRYKFGTQNLADGGMAFCHFSYSVKLNGDTNNFYHSAPNFQTTKFPTVRDNGGE